MFAARRAAAIASSSSSSSSFFRARRPVPCRAAPPPSSAPLLTDDLHADTSRDAARLPAAAAARLERAVFGVRDAALRPVALAPTAAFVAPAPGLRWLRLRLSPPASAAGPATCACALALPRAELCRWPWRSWRGAGSLLGARVTTTLLAPLPPRAAAAASTAASRRRPPPPRREGAGLAVRLVVRHYRLSELERNPLLVAAGHAASSAALAQMLVRLHMLRNGAGGEERGTGDGGDEDDDDAGGAGAGAERRPPQVLHSWACPREAGASGDTRDVLGVDYEAAPRVAQPPRRHALSFVVDRAGDCVLEVCLSAPAMRWDELWEGESADADAPTADDMGLAGRGGLRGVLESLTVAMEPEEDGEGSEGEEGRVVSS